MPTPDSGYDFVGIGFPDEGARLLIVLFDEAVDGGLQIDNGMEDTVFQSSPGELAIYE